MKEKTIKIVKQDDFPIKLTVKDNDGAVVDLTGYKFYFTAKKNKSQTDANADIQVSQTSIPQAASGIVTIDIPSASTNIDVDVYYYDIQAITAAGEVRTVLYGNLEIVEEITKATT